MNMGLGHRKT